MKQWFTWFALLFAALPMRSWATWSVVAVDPQTGEVGAAGATCWPDVAVIARLVPGKGAVVAQGLTSEEGRDHASKMLNAGSAAQAVIEEITSKQVDKSFVLVRSLRQYGVATLQPGPPTTASFTGFFTSLARGVREASGVSVQGNMLASEDVLDKVLERYSTRWRPVLVKAVMRAVQPSKARSLHFCMSPNQMTRQPRRRFV
jgi:uncharacterized Ntn-hydrolase superfamily protein